MPPADGLKVIHSRIHGYGLATLRTFRKGEIVVYGDGVVYRESDDFDDEYALIMPGYELDEVGQEGPSMYYDLADQTRWINHSCSPNTEVDTAWDPVTETARAWWVATRDIEEGEELAYDYAFSGHLAIPCRCETELCRGLIVDEDELHLVPKPMRKHIRRSYRPPEVADKMLSIQPAT